MCYRRSSLTLTPISSLVLSVHSNIRDTSLNVCENINENGMSYFVQLFVGRSGQNFSTLLCHDLLLKDILFKEQFVLELTNTFLDKHCHYRVSPSHFLPLRQPFIIVLRINDSCAYLYVAIILQCDNCVVHTITVIGNFFLCLH